MSAPERPAAPEEPDRAPTAPAAAPEPDAEERVEPAPPATLAELGLGEWVRAHRARLEILAIAVLAIGGIVCMFITTLALVFGLRR